MSSIHEGTLLQNQLKTGASASVGISSTGFPGGSINLLNNLANINATVGHSPKIVPTLATSAMPPSSRVGPNHIHNENSNMCNAIDNNNRNNTSNSSNNNNINNNNTDNK